MIHKKVDDVRELMPTLLPEIMSDATMGDVQYDDDIAIITYTLSHRFEVEDIKDIIEEQMELNILYYFVPSEHTTFGQQLCAYSDHNFGHMFKVHATTNGAGLVDMLVVTVFDSPEIMCINILFDLDLHVGKGKFISVRDRANVLIEFC